MESDLAIALDMSGSMEKENFRTTQRSLIELVYNLNLPQSKVSFLTFGSEANMRWIHGEYAGLAEVQYI